MVCAAVLRSEEQRGKVGEMVWSLLVRIVFSDDARKVSLRRGAAPSRRQPRRPHLASKPPDLFAHHDQHDYFAVFELPRAQYGGEDVVLLLTLPVRDAARSPLPQRK